MDAIGGSDRYGGVVGGGLCVALAAVGISCAPVAQAQDVTMLPQANLPIGSQDVCYVVQSGISKQFYCTNLGSGILTLKAISALLYCGTSVTSGDLPAFSGSSGCLFDTSITYSSILTGASIISGSGDVAFSGPASATLSTTLTSVFSGGTNTKITANSKGLVTAEAALSATDLPLQGGGVMYPLGDNSGSITSGLYTAIGGFPWSSGNITSMYAGIGSGSMTLTLYSATSEGATLSAVAGCSGIVVSAGGAGSATSCTSTPISRNGQIFCSVSSVTPTGTNGYCEPVFTRTGA